MAEEQSKVREIAGSRQRFEEALALCDPRLQKPIMSADIYRHLMLAGRENG